MGEIKKETKNAVSACVGKAISKRILVADDNKVIRNAVSRFLEFMGFEVAIAGNGIEALAVFLESSFDLVLTDFQMPAMDGLSLAGHIKERSPSTPVILITGSDRETVRKRQKEDLLTQSYLNLLDCKTFKVQSRERWLPETENREAQGWGKVLALLRRNGNRRLA
jgi:CheY-like chemotaxis protein